MIVTKYGSVKVDGSETEIEADLLCIIHTLDLIYTEKYNAEYAEKIIRKLVDTSFGEDVRNAENDAPVTTQEDIREAIEALEKIKELSEKFLK